MRIEQATKEKLRRVLPTATIAACIGTAIIAGVTSEREPQTPEGLRQPSVSCEENPRGYVTQILGHESVVSILGVRQNASDQLPYADDTVAINGDERLTTIMLPSGSRVVFPDDLEAVQTVQLPGTAMSAVRLGRIDGQPAIAVGCSEEAFDGTVFDQNVIEIPPMTK